MAAAAEMRVRWYHFPQQAATSGILISLPAFPSTTPTSPSSSTSPPTPTPMVVRGADLLRALAEDEGVDFGRFEAFAYDVAGGGNVRVTADSELDAAQCRDIKVIRRAPARCSPDVAADRLGHLDGAFAAADGYYGIGIVRGKTEGNHGTLWRSAYQLGAAFVFTVGAKYRSRPNGRAERNADVTRVWTHLPVFHFADEADLTRSSPYSVPWVGIEMGGEDLDSFEHPERAVYILGSENNGLPKGIARACQHLVSIPSDRYASYNVAVAGSLVMYDRLVKQRRLRLGEGGGERGDGGGVGGEGEQRGDGEGGEATETPVSDKLLPPGGAAS